MKKPSKLAGPAAELRRRAEHRLLAQPDTSARTESQADGQRLLQELQIHKIELELQNEELKASKAELDAGLEKYTDLYDFAPVGYFTLAIDGTIQQVNLTGTTLVGIDRRQLVGRRFGLLLAAELRPVFNAFLKQVFACDDKHSSDFELQREGLPPLIIKIEARCLLNGLECHAVVVDVTKRKQAEDKVLVSEIRYRRLFEAAQDGVLLVDPGTRKITDANPFMTKLLGYSRDELTGKELFEIGLLKDEAASQEMFRKLKRNHQVRYDNLPLKSEGGRHQEVEVVANLYQENGHPVIQCNIRDITARRRAEETQRRLDILTASNEKLKKEIIHRQAVEEALTKSEQRALQLLEQSRELQKKLRHVSHKILQAQEDLRKQISHELHDKISQLLLGINMHLGLFTKEAAANPKGIKRAITPLRRRVEQSVRVVHQFSVELRPLMLDELGLIPALQTYIDAFPKRKGRAIHFTALDNVDALDNDKRTMLYRVAQEALINVAKHAKASVINVILAKVRNGVSLEITDNGIAFDVGRIGSAKWANRLGLTGMRERVEMVGGVFTVTSAPGTGTTIQAVVPLGTKSRGK